MTHVYPFKDDGSDRIRSQVFDKRSATEAPTASTGGGSTPTGTGFVHVTGGVQDAAARDSTEAEVTFTDITTNNASTTKHGYLKKLSNVSTEFMNGLGNWATPGAAIDTTVVTFNPSDKSASITLSSSDMVATKSAAGDAHCLVRLNVARATGYWYCEFDITADSGSGNNMIGLCDPDDATTNYVGQGTNGAAYYGSSGEKYKGSGNTAFGSTFTTAVIGLAWGGANGFIWFAKNNVWQASGSPSTFKVRALTTLAGMYPALSIYKGGSVVSVRLRAKSSDLTYTPPAGFLPYDQN